MSRPDTLWRRLFSRRPTQSSPSSSRRHCLTVPSTLARDGNETLSLGRARWHALVDHLFHDGMAKSLSMALLHLTRRISSLLLECFAYI